jgi:hypothetical protein
MKSLTCHGMSLEITGYHAPISRLFPVKQGEDLMRNRWIENYLYLGLFLFPPLLIGYCAGKKDFPRRPNVVTVDIVKERERIMILDHSSGTFLAAYNKKEDKYIYKEFENLLETDVNQ